MALADAGAEHAGHDEGRGQVTIKVVLGYVLHPSCGDAAIQALHIAISVDVPLCG